jgi:hypothetical protein
MGTFGAHRRLISRRLTASNILASRCFLNSVVNRDFTSIAVTDLPSSSHALNFNKLIANAHHVTRISCQDGRAFSMSLWPKIESSVTVENECVEKPTIVNVAGCGFGKSLFMRSSNKITPVLEGTMKFGEDGFFYYLCI